MGGVTMIQIIEQLFNRIAALILLVFLSPLLFVVLVLLKVEDPKLSPFFTQKRVGKDQRSFSIYKLRSMRPISETEMEQIRLLNEAGDVMFKIKDDPRITRIGKFIRKTSIDELPQLLNVLKGDMSLVGPRPPLPSEVEKYTAHDLQRLAVLPGCTGLWQISGRSDTSFDEMVELDLQYIEKQSLWFDFKILLLTIPSVLKMKGAY